MKPDVKQSKLVLILVFFIFSPFFCLNFFSLMGIIPRRIVDGQNKREGDKLTLGSRKYSTGSGEGKIEFSDVYYSVRS